MADKQSLNCHCACCRLTVTDMVLIYMASNRLAGVYICGGNILTHSGGNTFTLVSSSSFG